MSDKTRAESLSYMTDLVMKTDCGRIEDDLGVVTIIGHHVLHQTGHKRWRWRRGNHGCLFSFKQEAEGINLSGQA